MLVCLLLILLCSGCEQISVRPKAITAGIRADTAEKEATAMVLRSYAAYVDAQVLCLQARFPKGVPSLAMAQRECGILNPSPVQVLRSEKIGEVGTTFSVIPGGGLGSMLGGILP